jgi:signal transduction histidine kinase
MTTSLRVTFEGQRLPEERRLLISSLTPGKAQNRLALGIVLAVFAVFVAIAGGLFSGFQPVRIDAFIPAYATAMFVNDMFTAILLFSQFSMLRSRALLVIATGYLFTALILLPWILTFPGLFAPKGLIGGLQSTSALYLIWHGGFLLYMVGYALTKDSDWGKHIWRGTVSSAVAWSVATTVLVVAVAALVCTAGEPLLPRVASDTTRFTPLWLYFVGAPIAALAVCALTLLWKRRRSALDLWLMVVACLYLVEVPLSIYPDAIRFSAGFYAVRVIGYLASSLVLLVLLYEIIMMYRLLGVRAQRREREARLTTGDAVTASVAHEVRQPLTAMIANADAGLNLLRELTPDVERAKQALERIVADGHRTADILGSIRAIYKSDFKNRASLDIGQLIRETLALVHGDLQKHGIASQFEQTGGLPPVSGDEVQIRQVLLNLVTNAIDAMATREGPRSLGVKSEPCESDGLVVSVADTGSGVIPENLDRIFDPLFTTKPEGMGMGLSICRSIIERHGGRLWVAPNAPKGAVFQFTLHADGPTLARA